MSNFEYMAFKVIAVTAFGEGCIAAFFLGFSEPSERTSQIGFLGICAMVVSMMLGTVIVQEKNRRKTT